MVDPKQQRLDSDDASEPNSFDGLLRAMVPATDTVIAVGDDLLAGRFHIEAQIGEGGMGVVYRALDRERGVQIALKTLNAMEPGDITRLKAEFRALSDVTHPNLVELHELFADGPRWFFTMELVDGEELLECLRGTPDAARTTVDVRLRKRERDSSRPDSERRSVAPSLPDLARLRDVFAQLVDGVSAIHAAGKLHCDLKPSNVMVDASGRVVVLDFGLTVPQSQRDAAGAATGPGRQLAGTPAYMSPEQAKGRTIGPASDWYAVGSILYEALTGQLPFSGGTARVLRAKQTDAPRPIVGLVPDLPEDLGELCMALLAHAPFTRPSPERIRALLGGAAPRRSGVPRAPRLRASDAPLVGRAPELSRLRQAFARASKGQTTALLVHGASGSGKSRLIEQFLTELGETSKALVLQARCYEREAVPYKAFDTLADALVAHLGALRERERLRLLPPDLHALARVLPAFAALAPSLDELRIPDAQELRFRAFSALKQLLSRLAAQTPLVLHVDDLQWGDIDGAELLVELLQPPDAPALLFLGSYRSDDRAQSPFLRRLAGIRHSTDSSLDEIALTPLDREQSEELATRLLEGAAGPTTAHEIARESAGSPLFIAELVAYRRARGVEPDAEPAQQQGFAEMIDTRLLGLGEDERRLLELVALAAQPLPQKLALAAAGLPSGAPILNLLRVERLVRSHGVRLSDTVECYHDRIREILTARLVPQRARALHLALAETLERDGQPYAEMITEHYLAAGVPARAAPFAALAADAAAAAFAFDRAARLYALALELLPCGPALRRELLRKRAQALVNAGRGADAAEVFLAASSGAPRAELLELEHSAAEQLLNTGHYERGRALLREVIRGFGLPYPEHTPGLVLGVATRALKVRVSGFRFTAPRVDVPARELQLLHVCWSAAFSLWILDPLRFAFYTLEFTLRSLQAGEPNAVAKARAIYGLTLVLEGPQKHAEAMAHIEAARSLARDDYARAYVKLTEAGIHHQGYLHREALQASDEAERRLSDDCTGVRFELVLARTYGFIALTALGEFSELRRRLEPFDREMARRDLFAELQAATFGGVATLMEDGDMAAACQRMRAIMARMPAAARKDYITASITIELYAGNPHVAWARIAELERELGKWGDGFKLYSTRIEYQLRRGQCSIMLARTDHGSERRRALRAAEGSATRLVAARSTVASAYAALLRAGIADTRCDRRATLTALRAADQLFAACDMPAYRALVQRRLGEFGELGSGEAARDFFERHGVRNPARLCGMYGIGQ
jgi:serine/threonine protein kinase